MQLYTVFLYHPPQYNNDHASYIEFEGLMHINQ